MSTVAEILGEKAARIAFDKSWANATKLVDSTSVKNVLKRIMVDIEVQQAAQLALIEELRDRIRRLEKQTHGVKWAGVWLSDSFFSEGSLATHDGALWVACMESKGVRPGDNSSSCWRLVCKSHP